jgi:hypothetical protein
VEKWFEGAPTVNRTEDRPFDFLRPNKVPSRRIVHTMFPATIGGPLEPVEVLHSTRILWVRVLTFTATTPFTHGA